MNFQYRIPFTSWTLRWIAWQRGETNFCLGVHMYPKGPYWNWCKQFAKGWTPIDSVMIHIGPLSILFTKEK